MQLILVHGYLAPNAFLWLLGHRLAAAGHTPRIFGYPSHRRPFDAHAVALAEAVAATPGPVGLIGHSLGGLLVHRAVERVPDAPVAAQIFIATPHQGSDYIRRVARLPLARRIAAAMMPGAFGVVPGPAIGHRAAIAGTRDAMVRPHEAVLPGVAFLALPYSHNELVWRARTADAIARFLVAGAFD